MKVYVVRGEYIEDGVFVVAARDVEEVKVVVAAAGLVWQEDAVADELAGVSGEGAPRIVWQ